MAGSYCCCWKWSFPFFFISSLFYTKKNHNKKMYSWKTEWTVLCYCCHLHRGKHCTLDSHSLTWISKDDVWDISSLIVFSKLAPMFLICFATKPQQRECTDFQHQRTVKWNTTNSEDPIFSCSVLRRPTEGAVHTSQDAGEWGGSLTLYEDELQGCEGGSFVAKVQNAAADRRPPRGLKPIHGIHQGLTEGLRLL